MERFKLIEEEIKEMESQQIISVKTKPLYWLVLLVVGIVLIVLGVLIDSEITTPLAVVIGFVAATVGVVFLLRKSVNYIYKPTGKRLKRYKIYLNPSDAKKVVSCINSNTFSGMKGMKKAMDSGHLIEARGTDDGEIFLLQLLEYIPHDFVPSSPVVVLHGEDAKSVLEFVKS